MRLISLAILAAVWATPALSQIASPQPVVLAKETLVLVTGEGTVSADPARMEISIGVATTSSTAAEALDANNAKMAPVIEALRREGIDPSDIRTSGLSVDAQYADRRASQEDRIIGFRAENTIQVSTSNLDRAGDLVSLLFDAGANTISGPEFFVAEEDEERLARLAEIAALQEARAQAETVAETLGLKVSRALVVSDRRVHFSESSVSRVTITGSRIMPTPLEPGKIDVDASYSVVYALIPG